jgi:anti-anti-sigma factor
MHTELGLTCDPPKARLRLSGEFDLSTNEQVADLFELATACGCHDLELDLSGVSFVDIGTLNLLDAHRRRVTSAGGSFVVVAESSCYRRVCDLAQLVALTVDGTRPPARRSRVPAQRPRGHLNLVGGRPVVGPPTRPHRV